MLSVGLCTVHGFLFNVNLTYIIMIHQKKTLYYNVKKNEDNPSKETSSFIYLLFFFYKEYLQQKPFTFPKLYFRPRPIFFFNLFLFLKIQ